MNYVAGQDCLCAVHVYPVVRFGVVRSPQSTELSSSTQCVLDSLKHRTSLGLMPLIIRPSALQLTVGLWVIDQSIIEPDAHFAAPEFYLIGREVCVVVSDDAVGDTITVYNPGYEVYHRSSFYPFGEFGEFIHHDQ